MTGIPRLNYLLHAAIVLLTLQLPVIFVVGGPGNYSYLSLISRKEFLLFALIYILLYVLHTFWMVPDLLFKQNKKLYFAILTLFSAVILIIRPFEIFFKSTLQPVGDFLMAIPAPPDPEWSERPLMVIDGGPTNRVNFDIFGFFLFLVLVLIGLAIMQVQRVRVAEREKEKLKGERLKAELSSLKAQIHPHFLFNTLNNIYSLSVTNSPNTSDAIMRLSNILRFHTDEVQQEYIPLAQEIQCVEDYVSLQQLRLGSKTSLDYEVPADPGYLTIPPLTLLPFVENVFKYGVSAHQENKIVIKIRLEKHRLTLLTINPKPILTNMEAREGIGIRNTLERLKAVFPDRFSHSVIETDQQYTMRLTIDLNSEI